MTGEEAGYVALGAGAVALVALVLALWSARWLRRIRRAQQALVAGESADLVEFAVGMQTRMEKVEDVVGKAVNEVSTQRKRLDSAYQRRALIRYDAIKDVGGRQSTTIALLDAHGSGIVDLGHPGPRLRAPVREGRGGRRCRLGGADPGGAPGRRPRDGLGSSGRERHRSAPYPP